MSVVYLKFFEYNLGYVIDQAQNHLKCEGKGEGRILRFCFFFLLNQIVKSIGLGVKNNKNLLKKDKIINFSIFDT